jgi:hypothetical protein
MMAKWIRWSAGRLLLAALALPHKPWRPGGPYLSGSCFAMAVGRHCQPDLSTCAVMPPAVLSCPKFYMSRCKQWACASPDMVVLQGASANSSAVMPCHVMPCHAI